MEFFESKKAILEHCGKDSKDVRWLDRAIKDGRVWECDGAYYVVSEYVTHLEEENAELEEKLADLKDGARDLKDISRDMGEKVLAHGEINKLQEEVKELRQHLRYVWWRNDARRECLDSLTQSYYNKNRQQYDFEDAKKKFYGMINYVEDLSEDDERAWAVDNWILLQ